MNEDNSGTLVGLLLGAFVFSLLGFSGIRSLISGLRNLSKKKYPRLYNYFGIIAGAIIVAWVLFLFLVIGYFWLMYK
jgi:amino acid permease